MTDFAQILSSDDRQLLGRLAREANTDEESFARSLLSSALHSADMSSSEATRLLNEIPGAFDSAERGRREAEAGLGTPLDNWRT